MIFSYNGYDQDGNKVNGRIEAISLDEAKQKIKSQKIIYSMIKEETQTLFDKTILKRKYKISNIDLAELSNELAIYMQSGMSIVVAIKVAKTHYEDKKKIYTFLEAIESYLQEGKSFYSALMTQNILEIPDFYKQSIKVSESGGILAEVLLELSAYIKEGDRVSKEIKSALVYPMFIITVSLFMVSFMLVYIVPQVTSMFENLKQELPLITKIVIASGDFFTNNALIMAIVLVFFILSFAFLKQSNTKFEIFVDSMILKTPLIGKIVLNNELGRFSYIASVLLKSGVNLVESITLCADTLKNSHLKAIIKSSANNVIEGDKLSNSLKENNFKYDKTFINSISIGEESSTLIQTLNSSARLYFEKNKNLLKIFISILEPALMLVVGSLVGVIVIAMLLPIFSMSIQ
jgi:general secretion pathway protein F/type IV pilus assembly protein PilC